MIPLPRWLKKQKARKASRLARSEWQESKRAFIACKARKDDRGLGEAIRRMPKANCAVLRAERDAGLFG